MLIYNHKKDFLGIDEEDLRSLKLKSLKELVSEVDDFADLFVKTPGYVHNFKHIHWIDFLVSGESLDENKVIINIKGKVFKASLNVSRAFFKDEPARAGYIIDLQGIRELTQEELSAISSDLASMKIEKKDDLEDIYEFDDTAKSIEEFETKDEEYEFNEPIQNEEITLDEFDSEEKLFEEPEKTNKAVNNFEENDILDIDEDLFADTYEEETKEEKPQTVSTQPTPTDDYMDEDDEFANYHYDPNLASSELGLPVDLVEEFIQDFIAQSEDFKDDLYTALDNGRLDSVKTLSHKLKGVAANLRIEDALATLITINTSDNTTEIKRNLDKFYNVIIKKLSGKEPILPVNHSTQNRSLEEKNEKPLNINKTENIQDNDDNIDLKPDEADSEPAKEQNDSIDIFDDDLFMDSEIQPQNENISFDDTEEVSLKEEHIDIKLDDEETANEEELVDIDDEISLETNKVVIDSKKNASLIGIDVDEYKELLEDYKIDAAAAVEQLKESLSTNDKDNFKNMCLRLKGMSDNMHIDTVSEKVDELISSDDVRKEAVLNDIADKISKLEILED